MDELERMAERERRLTEAGFMVEQVSNRDGSVVGARAGLRGSQLITQVRWIRSQGGAEIDTRLDFTVAALSATALLMNRVQHMAMAGLVANYDRLVDAPSVDAPETESGEIVADGRAYATETHPDGTIVAKPKPSADDDAERYPGEVDLGALVDELLASEILGRTFTTKDVVEAFDERMGRDLTQAERIRIRRAVVEREKSGALAIVPKDKVGGRTVYRRAKKTRRRR